MSTLGMFDCGSCRRARLAVCGIHWRNAGSVHKNYCLRECSVDQIIHELDDQLLQEALGKASKILERAQGATDPTERAYYSGQYERIEAGAEPNAWSDYLDARERQFVALLNDLRAEEGLPRVESDELLKD